MKTTLHHGFNPYVAKEYGLEEAILIHHFQHWIQINYDGNRNERDGRFWTYQTLEDIALNFPYLNRDKVKRIISSLVEKGVIIKGNYNKNKYDRTVWYSFYNQKDYIVIKEATLEKGRKCHMVKAETPDGNGESDTPIPNTLTNNKKQQTEVVVFSCLSKVEEVSDYHKNSITESYLEAHVEHAVEVFDKTPKETMTNPPGLLESFCKRSRDTDCKEPKIPESKEDLLNKNTAYLKSLIPFCVDPIGFYKVEVSPNAIHFITDGQDASSNRTFTVDSNTFISDVSGFYDKIKEKKIT